MKDTTDITDKLEAARYRMMEIYKECQRDAHEDNKLLRIRYMMADMADTLKTICWALKRQIDPHSD